MLGTIVPITGFANSIVSPAMEYKSEGFIMGVGAKMFTVAGPVLVYGISSSILVLVLIEYFARKRYNISIDKKRGESVGNIFFRCNPIIIFRCDSSYLC